MAEITAEMVRQLREQTGAGMMDCKKALTEAGGDMAEAIVVIRKKGQDKAVNREGRIASEGIVESFTSEAGDVGVLLELNCETDFVARGEAFHNLAAQLARIIANSPAAGGFDSAESLNAAPTGNGTQTVLQLITESAGPIGEKVALTRFARYDAGSETQAIGTYIHRTDHKTGVIVEVASDGVPKDAQAVTALARELALHIAAAKPQFVSREEVPAELIENERRIATSKANEDPKFASKPDKAKTAMIEGQIRKYLEQTVLMEQPFVRDSSGKQRISHLVADAAKQAGTNLRIVRFDRYRVGETQAKTAEGTGTTHG